MLMLRPPWLHHLRWSCFTRFSNGGIGTKRLQSNPIALAHVIPTLFPHTCCKARELLIAGSKIRSGDGVGRTSTFTLVWERQQWFVFFMYFSIGLPAAAYTTFTCCTCARQVFGKAWGGGGACDASTVTSCSPVARRHHYCRHACSGHHRIFTSVCRITSGLQRNCFSSLSSSGLGTGCMPEVYSSMHVPPYHTMIDG